MLWAASERFSQARTQEAPLSAAIFGLYVATTETSQDLMTGVAVVRKAATAITQALGHGRKILWTARQDSAPASAPLPAAPSWDHRRPRRVYTVLFLQLRRQVFLCVGSSASSSSSNTSKCPKLSPSRSHRKGRKEVTPLSHSSGASCDLPCVPPGRESEVISPVWSACG